MGATAKEKKKASMARSVENIVFSTKMGALDYESSREEETFSQFIGLDIFVTRVSWEILNPFVMQEVITNMEIENTQTILNDNIIPIFGK